jgi:hypothetical protein
MISLRALLIGLGVLLTALFLLDNWRPHPDQPPLPAPAETGDAATLARELEAEKAATERRRLELMPAQREAQRQDPALLRRREVQQQILNAHRAEWKELIDRHLAEFLRLRDEATKSVDGQVSCTLCNDSYHATCFFCADASNGKCAACGGSGRSPDSNVCPACSGHGKCFKCAGLKKMPCPFCDQRGVVHRDSPRPSPVPIFQ